MMIPLLPSSSPATDGSALLPGASGASGPASGARRKGRAAPSGGLPSQVTHKAQSGPGAHAAHRPAAASSAAASAAAAAQGQGFASALRQRQNAQLQASTESAASLIAAADAAPAAKTLAKGAKELTPPSDPATELFDPAALVATAIPVLQPPATVPQATAADSALAAAAANTALTARTPPLAATEQGAPAAARGATLPFAATSANPALAAEVPIQPDAAAAQAAIPLTRAETSAAASQSPLAAQNGRNALEASKLRITVPATASAAQLEPAIKSPAAPATAAPTATAAAALASALAPALRNAERPADRPASAPKVSDTRGLSPATPSADTPRPLPTAADTALPTLPVLRTAQQMKAEAAPSVLSAWASGQRALASQSEIRLPARHTAPASNPASDSLNAALASLNAQALSAPASLSDRPVLQGHISTPVSSPEFHASLASSVRGLLRQGGQAQFSLNPLEMGPITVKVDLQGDQARVTFSAEVASTRDLLDKSQPWLSQALGEAGLRLVHSHVAAAGNTPDPRGGFQQPGQQGQPQNQPQNQGQQQAGGSADASGFGAAGGQPQAGSGGQPQNPRQSAGTPLPPTPLANAPSSETPAAPSSGRGLHTVV